MNTVLQIAQPAWLAGFIAARALPRDDAGRLSEVLALAAANVARGTGGPFAAAVYDEATGERLACAVNVVVPQRCSLAHAETMALALAQQALAARGIAVSGPLRRAAARQVLADYAAGGGRVYNGAVHNGIRDHG